MVERLRQELDGIIASVPPSNPVGQFVRRHAPILLAAIVQEREVIQRNRLPYDVVREAALDALLLSSARLTPLEEVERPQYIAHQFRSQIYGHCWRA